ncbi:GGDEF domain-containing protein [Paraliomyxa miuraensis]|uniref:GGDEF domain-containing protein n=1 Tax=Paraliomyxa miuraensis TaxID=376150 RepID=UPI00224DEABB|nr:GGDEF domain-containing protein [Paraliomyxa miuraensis]MCX4242034.1 GGDEF domain-containing protein [Paraliomyxa miuraensis]
MLDREPTVPDDAALARALARAAGARFSHLPRLGDEEPKPLLDVPSTELASLREAMRFAREALGDAFDQVLREIAELLREGTRKLDLVARHQGARFALVFPGLDRTETSRRVEVLRAAVEQRRFEADGVPHQLTVSCGVAELGLHHANADALLELAATRLRHAGRCGGNRIVASND